MKKDILKCINTIDEFDVDKFNKLNIGVEIQDFTSPNLSNEKIDELIVRYKEVLNDFKNTKALHGPFLDLKPASPDLEIRRISYNKYLRALEIASELDVDFIIFHSQIVPWLNEPNIAQLNNIQARKTWESLLSDIGEFKATIVLENIFESTPEMILDLISNIDLPNIRVNLDIGHARLGTVSLEKWIMELKDYLAYIHLHSNDGNFDLHTSPSEVEIIALKSLLNKYDLNPPISLEYKSDNIPDHIEILRK